MVLLSQVCHGVPLSPGYNPNRKSLSVKPKYKTMPFWKDCAMAYFDVKFFNPFAISDLHNTDPSLYFEPPKSKINDSKRKEH